jgi:hypothetical protein
MMHDFLANNRDELARRCRAKVAKRPGRAATQEQLRNGIPMFLEQLIRVLQIEHSEQTTESLHISGRPGGGATLSALGTSAALHGHELLLLGFSVDQVVHDYGDLCQAITDLAFERDAPFQVDEFRTLNRCLDNAIADAVMEFSYQRDLTIAEKNADESNQKLGFFAHELRNALNTAMLAFFAAKEGNLNLSGSTGKILERSLEGLRLTIDRSLADVRRAKTDAAPPNAFSVAAFIEEIAAAGGLAAKVRGCTFIFSDVDTDLAIYGNRDLLYSAVWNLLQNAFKFTRADTEVTLNAYAAGDRILIDVKDHCGGLPLGGVESIFKPFEQRGEDRTGLGLGLSISRQCVTESGGTLTVVDVPNIGCVFTVNLPRHQLH